VAWIAWRIPSTIVGSFMGKIATLSPTLYVREEFEISRAICIVFFVEEGPDRR
jgi:hypothetical protein